MTAEPTPDPDPPHRARPSGRFLPGTTLALLLAGCASAPVRTEAGQTPTGPEPGQARVESPGTRIPIELVDQLPRRSYPVDSTASALLTDDRQFAALAVRLEADLRSDLATYDIQDRATMRDYYGALNALALVRGDFDAAVGWADSARSLEDKAAPRLLSGTLERSLAAASRAPAERFEAVFRDRFRRETAALPYDQVRTDLTSRRAMLEIMSPEFVIGSVRAQIDPAAESGEISMDLARQVVGMRFVLDRLLPVRDMMVEVLDEMIASHAVEKPDIWPEREVSLEGRTDLSPVIVAIWDTGVDPELFPDRLFTNPAEVPDNGRDDDGNGFIDDVHGIAHGEGSEITTGLLLPTTLTPTQKAEYLGHLKGRMDLLAGLETPDAQAYRKFIAGVDPDSMRSFLMGMDEFGAYVHGSHVAGIAARGNPAVRLLIARSTYDTRTAPQLPTIELSHAVAKEFRETVEYFEANGVRVVNMSWGLYPGWYEWALEANNAGGTPEERRELARRIFDIQAEALREAIASASDILFVAGAGNENSDNRFNEFLPASLDLPNLITAGAVDQAGEETAFTSYGKVEVYASGYEVPSTVPGGEEIPWSGTSMAAPQVANLAAKLLALEPDLTVPELRRAIVDAAEETTIGAEGRTIHLLHPRASVERVTRKE